MTEAMLNNADQLEQQQIAMREGARLVLRDMLKEELPAAVEEGIKRVLTPDLAKQFAEAFIDVMKAQASVKVDSWAGAAVKGLARKLWENLWLIVFFAAVAYSIGGFGGMVAAAKWAIQEALQ